MGNNRIAGQKSSGPLGTRAKPPVAYYGGKTVLAPRIVQLLPPHEHYVEPFGGSLAVLLAKPRSPFETVNDLDEYVMTFWRVLRDRPEDLAKVCALTPHSRREHELSYEMPEDLDELEKARRVWIGLSQGRGGSLRKTGWRFYRKPVGTMSMPKYLAGYVDRIHDCAERIHGVSLECRPALEVITDYGQHEGVLIYADPPYLGETRSSRQYRHEMSHREEHEALSAALRSCKAAVVLSAYHSPLYDELYDGWHSIDFPAFTGQANKRGDRTEVLWSNRDLAPARMNFEEEAV